MLQRIKQVGLELVSLVLDGRMPPATPHDRQLIQKLRLEMLTLNLPSSGESPSEQPWLEHVARLRESVLGKDPREFLRWDVIQRTMFVTFAKYIITELRYLRQRPDWAVRWRPALRENRIGRPLPFLLYPRTSANLIHHSYHLAQFEACAGVRVDRIPVVIEFGGGYGGMCRLFHRLGFSGKYVIVDLPGFSALQRYYLSTLDLPVDWPHEPVSGARIFCVSSLDELASVTTERERSSAAFVATWSLSEAPLHVREQLLPFVGGCSHYLTAYQRRFAEIDNHEYFERWRARSDQSILWSSWEIPHLPGNRYLIGHRRLGSNSTDCTQVSRHVHRADARVPTTEENG